LSRRGEALEVADLRGVVAAINSTPRNACSALISGASVVRSTSPPIDSVRLATRAAASPTALR
jgi:hypothetical protein